MRFVTYFVIGFLDKFQVSSFLFDERIINKYMLYITLLEIIYLSLKNYIQEMRRDKSVLEFK